MRRLLLLIQSYQTSYKPFSLIILYRDNPANIKKIIGGNNDRVSTPANTNTNPITTNLIIFRPLFSSFSNISSLLFYIVNYNMRTLLKQTYYRNQRNFGKKIKATSSSLLFFRGIVFRKRSNNQNFLLRC